MNSSLHSLEQIELMAYLDGELSAQRAGEVAAHVEQCSECRVTVAEFRALSEGLSAWQVETAAETLLERVMDANNLEGSKPPTFQLSRRFTWLDIPRWVWVTAVMCTILIIALFVVESELTVNVGSSAGAASHEYRQDAMLQLQPDGFKPTQAGGSTDLLFESVSHGAEPLGGGSREPKTAPMVVRTASLSLQSKDFISTREALEELIRRHRGYSAQLSVGNETGSGHQLSATFRVPADELDATIAEIKQLGPVEQESQNGEEVTQQYVDLTARLTNSRRTEQTLLDLLQHRTGKLSDVLEVEQELARVREEIERMEAERKSLQNRVSFATLEVILSEKYKANLQVPRWLGGRFHNAMVKGFETAGSSLISVAIFVFNVGPFVIVWMLIFAGPAYLVWRWTRARSAHQPSNSMSPKA